MGGYDIFKSEFKDGKWSKPKNLGYPLNTPGDDIFLVVSANGRIGYYATEFEDSKGSRDIYRVIFVGSDKSPVVSSEERPLASLTGTVKQELLKEDECVNCAELTLLKGVITGKGNKPLEASIEIVNNTTGELIFQSKSNKSTGAFLVTLPSGFNYGISVSSDGYLFHSENFNIPKEAKYKEVEKLIELQTYEVGSTIVLRNIFFEFGKSTISKESTTELEKLYEVLKENPNIKIEVSGHTDNVGSAASNKSLSNARAKAVVDYLINKGISSSRLTSVGYGFDKPIASNDTEEGRSLNRRTEFTITSK
jgi:outer membrane protein OmpA-like peptidoglycan-associated protein